MKRILMVVVIVAMTCCAEGSTGQVINDITWYWEYVSGGKSALTSLDASKVQTDVISVPSSFTSYSSSPYTQYPLVEIRSYAFRELEFTGVVGITLPEGVLRICDHAFADCTKLKQITIPSTITYIGADAFSGCSSLTNITFVGDMPTLDSATFLCAPRRLTITVGENSIGWDYYKKNNLLTPWEDRTVIKPGYPGSGDEPVSAIVALATTNVVIHYLTTNVPVNVVAPISKDTAIVNVMTEIEGGNIAIPDTWAKNYPNFEKRFGSDFSAALTKYTGKYDGAGNPLFVWQDYVAGTDPTDVYDVFTATITLVEGKPQVQWDPVLVEKEAAKRVYTKYGKVKLTDEWEVISEGNESNYNFFKVTVKMK